MFDGSAILRVRAKQSRVGAVQRGNDRRRRRADHLGREKSGGGVRNGVVHMKDIKRFGPADFSHPNGQRQGVIRAGKDRGAAYRYLVKMDPRLGKIEPDRPVMTEEVNLVAAIGQLHSKSGGENAAAADQRKTDDPNLERRWHF